MTMIKTEALKKKQEQDLNLQFEKDKEKVRGIFKFHEVPGGLMSFVYKKYKQDPVARYDMIDGEVYTVPLGIAKHLNKNGWYPIHHHTMNDEGKPSMKIGQKKRRFSFQSLEFIDTEDLTEVGFNDIVTAEAVR